MSQPARDSQLDALFRARPELRLAVPYLAEHDGPAQLAFAAIAQQWADAVYSIRDFSVAAPKLRWWVDELRTARDGGDSHHPLANTLFTAPAARDIDPELWRATVEAGLALREAPPAADLAAQLRMADGFHGKLARLETELCHGPQADAGRAARVSCVSHLLSSLFHLVDSQSANDGLPMRQLARHHLTRQDLQDDSPARRAALRDHLADLQNALADAMSATGPMGLACALTAHADRAQLRKALHADQPLAVLAGGKQRLGPAMAWRAWRLARRQRRLHPKGSKTT